MVATVRRREGVYNRTGELSVPFYGEGGMAKRYKKDRPITGLFEWNATYSDVFDCYEKDLCLKRERRTKRKN